MRECVLLDKIKQHRQEILWWEFCGLLHDIGKLSQDFITYRQTWHAVPGGWAAEDPHEHNWFSKKDHLLQNQFPALYKFFQTELIDSCPRGTLSVENAVDNHLSGIDPKCNAADGDKRSSGQENLLLKFLKGGDGLDARYDRNNPLLGCEQTDHSKSLEELQSNPPPVFKGNVFGLEKKIDPQSLERDRRLFYCELTRLLQIEHGRAPRQWDSRSNGSSNDFSYEQTFLPIRQLMETSWDNAMSDTTRPNNDTSLWEHVYSVSTISKAFHAEHLLNPKTSADEQQFYIVGIGFDWFHILSTAHKIGDVMGRSLVIDAIFDECIREFEFESPIGNHVYRDQDCLFVLIANCDGLIEEFQARATELCLSKSGGDIFPHFVRTPQPTRTLTVLPALIEAMREAFAAPVAVNPSLFILRLNQMIPVGRVCPICRLRRIERSPTALDKNPVCDTCNRRRMQAGQIRQPKQSVYLSEIADDNGRVALLQVRIGLRDWLNGKLIRTTFITEPAGTMKTLRAVRDGRFVDLDLDHELKQWLDMQLGTPLRFLGMKQEFAIIAELEAEQISIDARFPHLVYGRGLVQAQRNGDSNHEKYQLRVRKGPLGLNAWRGDLEGQPGFKTGIPLEELFNAVCAKTPTPSTLLDAWRTTEEFLAEIAGSPIRETEADATLPWLSEFLPMKPRRRVFLDIPGESASAHTVLTAQFGGAEFELLADKSPSHANRQAFWIIGAPESVTKTIKAGTRFKTPLGSLAVNGPVETVTDVYYPWRLITSSPNTMLLLVPANKATEIAKKIYDRFLKQFAKVYGRLPIAISTLIFPEHMPMFSVLDAARRTDRTMRTIQEQYRAEMILDPPTALDAHLALGDGSEDKFHPYMIVTEPEKFEDYVQTVEGPLIPFASAKGHKVVIRPNLYFWHWLGSSSARFELETKASCEIGTSEEIELSALLQATAPLRGDGSPALLLDELQAILLDPWETLRQNGVTDTSLRNVVGLYRLKNAAWRREPDTHPQLVRLVETSARKMTNEASEALVMLARKNQLESFARFHLHVLKHRLGREAEVTQ
jgi:hypothetical protein